MSRAVRTVPRRSAALLALAAVASLAGCEVLDPMITQQKVKPYRESDFWPDGLSMRPPQPGTVARQDALAPEIATGRGPDGKALERLPVPVTRKLLERGRTRFDIHCAVCHGHLGDGVSLVARNMSLRPPPSLLARAQQTDGWYFQVMSEGFGLMPSYASHLSPEDRWAVVAYLRALQLSQTARVDQLAPADRARLQGESR
jgi:mono/diheme cytochrome c family protein